VLAIPFVDDAVLEAVVDWDAGPTSAGRSSTATTP
jgi:hypothetical protein